MVDRSVEMFGSQGWNYYEELQTIEVLSVELEYVVDTKGFYRPIYVFETLINGSDVAVPIHIVA